MNWSRTKLLFIITFLILDLFLATQLYQKHQNAEQIQSLPGGQSSEERLKDNEIQWPSNLPEVDKASYIKGEPQSFKNSNGDLRSSVKKLAGHSKGKKAQKLSVSSGGHTLTSSFPKAKEIPDSEEDFASFLKKNIDQGGDYQAWKKSPSGQALILVQTYQQHPVFSKERSRTGMLRMQIEDDKVTGYRQTHLKFKKYGDKKEVIEPVEAIEKIWKDNDLDFGDKVDGVTFGYLNLTEENEGEAKTFFPVWYVRVNAGQDEPDEEYFVNAMNGVVQTLSEEETDSE